MSRASFDQVRADERARLRGLESAAGDFGLSADAPQVRRAWDGGLSPEDFRAELDARARQEQQRAQFDRPARPHPGGALSGAAATAAALTWFGRGDLIPSDVDRSALDISDPRAALHRIAGLQAGSGPAAEDVARIGLEAAGRVTFAGWGGVGVGPAALGSDTLGPAMRDAAMLIAGHAWGERGRLVSAVARTVETRWIRRAVRVYLDLRGGVAMHETDESGAAVRPPAGFDAVPYADVTVLPRREATVIDSTRVVDYGGSDAARFLAASVAALGDRLDARGAAALADTKLPAASGSFDAEHVAAGVQALFNQTAGGASLESGERPIIVAGRGRQTLREVAPRDADDRSALVGDVLICPAPVPADFAAVVSRQFAPLVLGALSDNPTPRVHFGSEVGRQTLEDAGVNVPAGRPAFALAVTVDVSDPALVLDSDGTAGLGAVRLTM